MQFCLAGGFSGGGGFVVVGEGEVWQVLHSLISFVRWHGRYSSGVAQGFFEIGGKVGCLVGWSAEALTGRELGDLSAVRGGVTVSYRRCTAQYSIINYSRSVLELSSVEGRAWLLVVWFIVN